MTTTKGQIILFTSAWLQGSMRQIISPAARVHEGPYMCVEGTHLQVYLITAPILTRILLIAVYTYTATVGGGNQVNESITTETPYMCGQNLSGEDQSH